jgi:hypothetical protein
MNILLRRYGTGTLVNQATPPSPFTAGVAAAAVTAVGIPDPPSAKYGFSSLNQHSTNYANGSTYTPVPVLQVN